MLRSLLLSLALAVPLFAQQPVTAAPLTDSTVVDTVAPGLVHTYYVRQRGPWRVHVVRVDLRSGQYDVRSVRALDSLRGRETVSGMMARARRGGRNVRVAINADFFNLTTGESVNNQVSDGRIWRALAWSGVPRPPMRSARGQFGMTRDGRPVIDRFVFTGTVHAGRVSWALDGVNVVPSNGQGLVLWLPEANGRYRADSSRAGRELRVTVVRGSWRDSLMLRVRGRVTAADSAPLAADEGALVAYGATAARLDSIARLQRTFDAHPSWLPTVGTIDQLVGGWPVILRDRVTMVEEATSREFTAAGNANVRHPRSFVGFDADTSHLYLVAVDGRSAASVGMTLVEAADFLRGEGVAHALNLDGGGSTALVVDGRVINTPSDRGGERTVANALLIEERRRPK
ncbi:MAG: phosphodiester glycosidase family protein [Gemmatimonadaceae bacterium]|nr:phosphodiester glycosidase family protein [Gemmatimonadaceae bacterium]